MKRANVVFLCALAQMIACVASQRVLAQSETLVGASASSLTVLSELPPAAAQLALAGGEFTVASARVSGESLFLVLTAAGESAGFAIELSGHAVAASAVAIGMVIKSVAVVGGCVLYAGAQAIAFIPDPAASGMARRRELR